MTGRQAWGNRTCCKHHGAVGGCCQLEDVGLVLAEPRQKRAETAVPKLHIAAAVAAAGENGGAWGRGWGA